MSDEIYKPINGYPNYELSNLGNVRRVISKETRQLNPWLQNGHVRVRLSSEGKTKDFQLHRLLLTHFGPPMPEDKPLALHRDDNPLHNNLDNLLWGDKIDNGQMAAKNGKLCDHHLKTFLTKDEAKAAKAAYEAGQSMKQVAKRFGCSRWTISSIVHDRTQKFL